MSPDNSSRSFSTPARLFLLICTLAAIVLMPDPAAAQPPGLNHARGQAAINKLGARLPAVAAQHNMAAQRLIDLFQSDPYLAVDDDDNLLFIDEFLPEEAGTTPPGGVTAGAEAIDPTNTFLLHSLPGAAKVIYLDFDGHTTSGTYWNSGYGATIVSAPYSQDADPAFSTNELTTIQYIWQRVAEDYLPYGVDVTTQDPGVEALRNSGGGDQYWGQRVVISPTNWYNTGAGGVAYIDSFSWNSDTPCFVFTAQLGNGNEKYTAEAASHEAGHTVGLYHDGANPNTGYYAGHSGWAPIMGVGYYQTLVQWSKGEYPNANNTEDDLTIMTGYGFTFRPDDHGNISRDATPLVVKDGTSVSGSGIIELPTDKDAFSFMSGAGAITLNVTGAPVGANLDIRADLYDSGGQLVVSANPADSLNATIATTVAGGTYTLIIDGVGKGDLVTGYSDYGSLGQYTITGTIVDPGVVQPPVAVASAVPVSGNAPLTVQFSSSGSRDPDGTIKSYAWEFGDGILDSTANPEHVYQNKGVYAAVLTVTDETNWTDSAAVTITVSGPPDAPTGLIATAASSTQINLAWTDNSADESGFVIDSLSNGTIWNRLATVGSNVTAYASTSLTPNTTHFYRVYATNGAGPSGYSNTATATTQSAPVLHVGDLDASRSVSKKSWSAKVTIAVHDALHKPVSGAVVTGGWTPGGTGSCTTSAKGTCTISSGAILLATTTLTFRVDGAAKAGWTYDAVPNHDPDGNSSGTAITIIR